MPRATASALTSKTAKNQGRFLHPKNTRTDTFRLLGAVKIRNNTDRGAQMRLNMAKSKAAKLDAAFYSAQAEAQEAYKQDEDKGSTTFKQWVARNVRQPKSRAVVCCIKG